MLASLGYDCFDDYDDCLPPGEDVGLLGIDATPHTKGGKDQLGGAAQSPQLCANSEMGMLSPSVGGRDINGSSTRMSRRMMDSSAWDTALVGRDLSFHDGGVGDGVDRDEDDADDVDMADD